MAALSEETFHQRFYKDSSCLKKDVVSKVSSPENSVLDTTFLLYAAICILVDANRQAIDLLLPQGLNCDRHPLSADRGISVAGATYHAR